MSSADSIGSRRNGLHHGLVAAVTTICILSLLALLGIAPLQALRELWRGAFGGQAATFATLRTFVPLCLTALGIAFAFRSGLWNIGAEGQFIAGSILAFAGTRLLAHPVWAMALGGLGGALWALLPVLLRVYRQVPEILATIMLNFVALECLRYCLTGPLQESSGQFLQSDEIPEEAMLPALEIGDSAIHVGFLLALAMTLAAAVVIQKTHAGLLLRATGANPRAVAAAGFSTRRIHIATFLVSGAFAGLAGSVQLLGVDLLLDSSTASGIGYVAIAVALLAGLRPAWIVPAALLFASLKTGTAALQWTADLSGMDRFALVAEGIILLGVLWPKRNGRAAGGAGRG